MIEVIKNRRSSREFSHKKVSLDIINELIEVAIAAPSAWNQRSCHFIIIRDKLHELSKVSHNISHISKSNVAIMVCFDKNLEKREGYWIQDCSAATQNILIGATLLGLGSCWVSIYPCRKSILKSKSILGIPEEVVPFSIVPIGYHHENEEITKRECMNTERIHTEHW